MPPSPGGQDSLIESGQAIFVVTNVSAAASLSFNETNKVTQNNLGMFRPAAPVAQPGSFRTNLYLLNVDNSTVLADGNYVQFDRRFADGVDNMDALKLPNVMETIGLLRNGVSLSIESRPGININDTLFLKLTKTTQRNYRFEFVAGQLDQDNLAGFLEDSYLHTSTPLNMNSSTWVDFTITADAASAVANRFRIIFRPSVSYTDIQAYLLNPDIAVEWKVGAEFNINRYEVERSVDGISFNKLGQQLSAGNSATEVRYNWLDQNPAPGIYYYRVKCISNNGVTAYSRVVKIVKRKGTPALYIFPNPVTGNGINLQMNDMPAGRYAARLLNSIGQVVLTANIDHAAGSDAETIPLNKTVARAVYELEISGPGNYREKLKLVY